MLTSYVGWGRVDGWAATLKRGIRIGDPSSDGGFGGDGVEGLTPRAKGRLIGGEC